MEHDDDYKLADDVFGSASASESASESASDCASTPASASDSTSASESAPVPSLLQNKKKLISVGGGNVGKTSLIWCLYTKSALPAAWELQSLHLDLKSINNEYTVATDVNGTRVSLVLVDSATQTGDESTRSIFYKGADVALICFSLADRESLESVKQKWIPELAHHCPKVPLILVGTKCDLPEDQRLPSKDLEKVVDTIKSVEYLECSSVTYAGVERLFQTAAEASFGLLRPPDILTSEKGEGCGPMHACLKLLH